MRAKHGLIAAVAGLVLLAATLTGCDWKGADPTAVSVAAEQGPFAIQSTVVPAGNGFGGGTVWYPTETSKGRFGGIAVVPGFLSPESSISWLGPRLASQGFVVITIATNTINDLPPQRAAQLKAALQYLTTTSVAAGRVDANRLGVMGWSMGGGGSLLLAQQMPTLKAIVPLAAWANGEDSKVFSSITVPTMLIACQNDTIAQNDAHSRRFYDLVPATTKKGYLEIAGGAHFCVTSPNPVVARYSIAWMKRWLDGDARYLPFICTQVPAGASAYKNTCPL